MAGLGGEVAEGGDDGESRGGGGVAVTGGGKQVADPPRQIMNNGFYLTAVITVSLAIPQISGGLIASLKSKPALKKSAALQGLNMLVAFSAVRFAKRARHGGFLRHATGRHTETD